MVLELIVTADAGVVSIAAKVLDGDNVERRMPMTALCKRRDGLAVHGGHGCVEGESSAGHGYFGRQMAPQYARHA